MTEREPSDTGASKSSPSSFQSRQQEPYNKRKRKMDASVGSMIFGTAIGAVVLGFAGLKKFKDINAAEKFKPTKKLGVKDELILAMLDDIRDGDARPCYVITDPSLQDNPIIFASSGFCAFTKYSKNEVEGRNCRFLQGPQTDKADIKKIRDAVHGVEELSACLLNYKKDGTTFINQFFLCPLFGDDGKIAYHLGVQKQVDRKEEKQDGKNPGWRIFMWL